jgi:hypothetical protein
LRGYTEVITGNVVIFAEHYGWKFAASRQLKEEHLNTQGVVGIVLPMITFLLLEESSNLCENPISAPGVILHL